MRRHRKQAGARPARSLNSAPNATDAPSAALAALASGFPGRDVAARVISARTWLAASAGTRLAIRAVRACPACRRPVPMIRGPAADPTAIEAWPADVNVGVGCRASSVVGLDLDRHAGGPDGVAAFARFCADLDAAWWRWSRSGLAAGLKTRGKVRHIDLTGNASRAPSPLSTSS